MKKYLHYIKPIVAMMILAGIVVGVHYSNAAGNYPQLNPPHTSPNLLFADSSSQAKAGSLALGAIAPGYNPQTALDVKGTIVTDILGVMNGGNVSSRFKIGGSTAPGNTGSQLIVEGSRIRSEIISGTGERTICADSDGRLKICNVVVTPPTNGNCGAANNTFSSTAPTTNLCDSGTASSVNGTGPWTWSCAGSNGGTTMQCGADLSYSPPTPVNGVCGGYLGCAAGSVINAQTSSIPLPNNAQPGAVQAQTSSWQCQGVYGGSTATCSSSFACPNSSYELVGCFTAGTEVTMADGTKKAIETIAAGESITASGNRKNSVEKVLVHNYQGWVYGINGSEPFVTGMHPMMTTEGWKSFEPEKTAIAEPDVVLAGKLVVGNILIKENGVQEKIKKVSRVWKTIPVYNLTVEGSHEYYADGFQVHNKSTNPYCAIPQNPNGTSPVDFCANYDLSSCTEQTWSGCSGPGQACYQATCNNIPLNSISNLSNYFNQAALNGWNYDPANASYYLSGGGYYDASASTPNNQLLTVICRSTIP